MFFWHFGDIIHPAATLTNNQLFVKSKFQTPTQEAILTAMGEFNCSRNFSFNGTIDITTTFIGNTISDVFLAWILCSYIIYLVYHIIKYIQAKPPNLQTMLDGFYVQLFVSWIIYAGMIMILELFIQLGSMNIQNEIITQIVAWLYFSSTLFMSVSFGTSSIARILLIMCPSLIEDLDDEKASLING